MRLSVSNIAWAAEDHDTACGILRDYGVAGLEIAPGLLFPDLADPFAADETACRVAIEEISGYGLTFSSMQSLLFGVPSADLFGGEASRARFEDGISAAVRLAGRLGVPNLVFGSPKNRVIPENLSADEARLVWLESFRRLGDLALKANTIIALEPNPPAYGANFMTTLDETLAVARSCDHAGIKVNLDLGALVMTGEIDRKPLLAEGDLALINHIHISTPGLDPVDARAKGIAAALEIAERLPAWVSIEMKGGVAALPAAISAVLSAKGSLGNG